MTAKSGGCIEIESLLFFSCAKNLCGCTNFHLALKFWPENGNGKRGSALLRGAAAGDDLPVTAKLTYVRAFDN